MAKKAKKKARKRISDTAKQAWGEAGKKEMCVNIIVRQLYALAADADVHDDSIFALDVAELVSDWMRDLVANGRGDDA